MRYTVLLRRNQVTPGYSAVVPELPGCFSAGRTEEEAIANSGEAIQLHLEGIVEHGEDILVELETFVIASVEVQVPVSNL